MSRLKTNLNKLEARLQAMIEGSAARLFFDREGQNDLASRLVEAMRGGIQTSPEGSLLAPNLFTLVVHQADVKVYRQNQELLDHLAKIILQSGIEAGLKFPSPPNIKVVTDPNVSPQQVLILAEIILQQVGQTATLAIETEVVVENIPANAFLIVGGMQVYPLTRPVINIGRRVDNHLVIEDLRVSRVHAQMRAIKGRYVIFDLGSRGGTFVNGERVKQAALHPGDVITLSDIPLVFGQEATPFSSDGQGSTHPIIPYPPEE